jgi:hypothetical protein
MNCNQVLEQLDLYAAGEADARTREAVQRHLRDCPDCAAAQAESDQLQALLDLHYQAPQRLKRLQTALAGPTKEQQRRPIVIFFLRRAVALAATLFLTIGLAGWIKPLGTQDTSEQSGDLVLALRSTDSRFEAVPAAQFREAKSDLAANLSGEAVTTLRGRLNLKGKSPAVYRQELLAAAAAGNPLPPPVLKLPLELRNQGQHDLQVWLGADRSELQLDLRGPGVLSVRGKDTLDQPFLERTTIRLAPGGRYYLPLDRLVYGSPRQIWYAYWTAAGTYTLTVRYRAVVTSADARQPERGTTVTIGTTPIRIDVRETPE